MKGSVSSQAMNEGCLHSLGRSCHINTSCTTSCYHKLAAALLIIHFVIHYLLVSSVSAAAAAAHCHVDVSSTLLEQIV